MISRRALAWGLAAVIGYLLAGSLVWRTVPLRILYEGEAPPLPYRWVHPPANLPEPNQAPSSGSGDIPLTAAGSQSASVITDDGQAALVVRFGAIALRPGATSVTVKITPLDPADMGPPPPGMQFDGNAYRMVATDNTRQPATLLMPVTPVLRYPKHATALLRWSGSGWVALESHVVSGSLQLFGPTDRLGVFVAAAPTAARRVPAAGYAAGAAIAAGVLASLAAWTRARRRARRRG